MLEVYQSSLRFDSPDRLLRRKTRPYWFSQEESYKLPLSCDDLLADNNFGSRRSQLHGAIDRVVIGQKDGRKS